MRVIVMGAGAMGSVVGGLMAQAGHSVALVGRARHMEAVRQSGLHITGIWGEHRVHSLQTVTSVADLPQEAADLILIAVKSYDTAAAVAAVTPCIAPETLVCAYQNGLGNAETIASMVGWQRTIGARAIFGARVVRPGEVTVTVIAEPTALGCYHKDTPVAKVQAIAKAMDVAGAPTQYTDKIRTVLWNKVAYNACLNPLSALLDTPYGVLPQTEYTRRIIVDIIKEIYAVAQAMQVPMEPRTPQEYERLLFEKLIPPTAAHYASMREDFVQRRRTEIDALNGAIVRFGHQQCIPCPVNALITDLVHARTHALGLSASHSSR